MTSEWTTIKRERREESRNAAFAEYLIARYMRLGGVQRATVLEIGVKQLKACGDDDARRLLLKPLTARMGPRRLSGADVVRETERRRA
jgi:hypothetical protein